MSQTKTNRHFVSFIRALSGQEQIEGLLPIVLSGISRSDGFLHGHSGLFTSLSSFTSPAVSAMYSVAWSAPSTNKAPHRKNRRSTILAA